MLARKEKINLPNNLKKRFLFRDDVSSATILIDLYEIEENLRDLKLRYLSVGELRESLVSYMRGRRGKHLAANNLTSLIHSDINRLELLICIEGHRAGLHSRKHANTVEEILLSNSNIHELYKNRNVLDDLTQIEEIDQFRERLTEYVREQVKKSKFIPEFVYRYITVKIRPRVYGLNNHLDKQLIVNENYRGISTLGFESSPFTRKELDELVHNIYSLLLDRSVDVFVESYWHGIEEKIRNRYR